MYNEYEYEDDIDQTTALQMMQQRKPVWFDNKKQQKPQQKVDVKQMSDEQLLELHEDKSIEVELSKQLGFNVTKTAAFLMHVKKEMIKRKLLTLSDATIDGSTKQQIERLKKAVDEQRIALEAKNKLINELKTNVFSSRINERNLRETKIFEEFKKLVKLEVGESVFLDLVETAQKTVEMKK